MKVSKQINYYLDNSLYLIESDVKFYQIYVKYIEGALNKILMYKNESSIDSFNKES